jgi:hypothetical protein
MRRDLTESIWAEVDSASPFELLLLAAAGAVLARKVFDVWVAVAWREGFRAGIDSPQPAAPPPAAPDPEA